MRIQFSYTPEDDLALFKSLHASQARGAMKFITRSIYSLLLVLGFISLMAILLDYPHYVFNPLLLPFTAIVALVMAMVTPMLHRRTFVQNSMRLARIYQRYERGEFTNNTLHLGSEGLTVETPTGHYCFAWEDGI